LALGTKATAVPKKARSSFIIIVCIGCLDKVVDLL
jgi:hypothetical protein